MRRVVPGTMLLDTRPEAFGVLVPRLNGDWLLPSDYVRPLFDGDVLEWHEMPQDKAALRTVLQVVVTIVAAYVGGPQGAAIAIAGSLAINVLIPIEPPRAVEQKSSLVYNTGLSGNQSRPFDPITKVMGRHQLFPNYAAMPYAAYTAYGTGDDGTEIGGEQMFYALYAVGVGNHVVERDLIDDTSISHFQDVLTARYLPPGVAPTAVNPYVVTVPEVAGQALLTGLYVGGFAACGPRKLTKRVEYDILMPNGIGRANDEGELGNHTVQWRVETRQLDEFGVATTPWGVYHTITKEGSTSKARRWTFAITVDTAVRPEVRIVRTDVRDENLRVRNDMVFASMRAFVDGAAPLNPNVAHYELVMRSSEQLSNISQGRLSLIVKAMTRTWSEVDGWSEEVETRNPAWWFAELATSPIWGLGLPDERVDLATIAAYAAIADERQDRFDYVMDTATDGWSALQLVARTMRCRAFRRAGVLTLARDQYEALPTTAFTHRNATGMKLHEQHPTGREPDGVIVEYFDYRAWEWMPVECPAPGVESVQTPARIRLPGITGPTHARREGLYEAASMALRTRTVSAVVEMEGVLPAFMSPVRFMPDVGGYGQTGDVAEWDPATLTMTLTEPPDFSTGALSISLVRGDGTVTDPIAVTSGVNSDQVVLLSAPDAVIFTDDGSRERTKFLLGVIGTTDELVKISAIADGGLNDDGLQLYQISAVIDDDRVHEADNDLLPGPGEVQDPVDPSDEVDDPNDGGGGQVASIPRLTGQFEYPAFFLRLHEKAFQFRTDGTLWIKLVVPAIQGSTVTYWQQANQWMLRPPVEATEAARFEIRWTPLTEFATVGATPESSVSLSANSGVWYPITEARTFSVFLPDMDPMENVPMFYIGRWIFEIREISTGIVQATGNYRGDADNTTPGS